MLSVSMIVSFNQYSLVERLANTPLEPAAEKRGGSAASRSADRESL